MRNRTIVTNIPKSLSTKEEIVFFLKSKKEPVPIRSIYAKFGHLSQRGIRQQVFELTTSGVITKVRCPCHISMLYTV
jgi:hypothetical protein